MKRLFTKALLTLTLLATGITTVGAQHTERPFLDTSRPNRFLDLSAYALAGGSSITQNYTSCFPEITELNSAMGISLGAGVGAKFALRDFLALGTEFNILVNNNTLDMAVTGGNGLSVSTVFLDNRYWTFNIPVYISLRFNLMRGVKWNVDCGMFYTYGVGGHQKQKIYDSRVNEIGQLVMRMEDTKTGYYNNDDAFINSYRRSDTGLHLGTGLSFGRHIFMGVRTQIGLKNVAVTDGIVKPNNHNINLLYQIGYRF